MSSPPVKQRCPHADLVSVYALHALDHDEEEAMRAHIAGCNDCRQELAMTRPVIDAFAAWPTDVLRPSSSSSLWDQVTRRIGNETGEAPLARDKGEYSEPEWEQVAPGIWCKLLATDTEYQRVSMLVRLAPGVDPARDAFLPLRMAAVAMALLSMLLAVLAA
jgi:hypothetical protein